MTKSAARNVFGDSPEFSGEIQLPGVLADIHAVRGGWASIYGWSGDGTGKTRDALRLLRSYSSTGVEVQDPGPPGSASRTYWDKMFAERLTDRMLDAQGEIIMTNESDTNLKRWAGRTKVTNPEGSPLVVFHASANAWEGDAFRRRKPASGKMSLGFHFGSAKAAQERIQPAVDEKAAWSWSDLAPHTIAVYLRIENPLRLRDIGSWHDPAWVLKALEEVGVQVSAATIAGIVKELKAIGHDGIVYANTVEDVGSDSWIAFDAKQIKSAIGNSGLFDRDSDCLVDRQYIAYEEDELAEPLQRMRA